MADKKPPSKKAKKIKNPSSKFEQETRALLSADR